MYRVAIPSSFQTASGETAAPTYLSPSGKPIKDKALAMTVDSELFAILAIYRFLPAHLHDVAIIEPATLDVILGS